MASVSLGPTGPGRRASPFLRRLRCLARGAGAEVRREHIRRERQAAMREQEERQRVQEQQAAAQRLSQEPEDAESLALAIRLQQEDDDESARGSRRRNWRAVRRAISANRRERKASEREREERSGELIGDRALYVS